MAIRTDLMKIILLLAVLFLLVKYPEQLGKFCSVALTGFTELLISKFLGNLKALYP
ncbi:hypothetical protein RE628_00770 [Paenibacillus sp. D2_2]|uniref:hypothetical protein n=1 Tax=Paenibacillus sp. D2_2 TaxID=3073092 RepID=UPI0028161B93|nr:hypothetical protein [Paenibacillus sp. D2_2]WMT41188.1 hypothetical protein RE628_00770 [Paenibacillus sp. D2_2]